MIPRAVLNAGRAVRQDLWVNDRNGEACKVQSGKGPSPAKNPVLFKGDYNACRDFRDDKVFRAMLWALADEIPSLVVDAYYLTKDRPPLGDILRLIAGDEQ